MAITVKLTDATIALSGDFAGALALIKSIAGRSYDGQTKAWSVPIDLKVFSSYAVGRSFDVLDAAKAHRAGEHVTRYGTRYARNEWDAKQASDNIQIPAELVTEAQARHDAAEQQFAAALGLDAAAIAKVRSIYTRFAGDFDEAEQYGHIKFSSPARKAIIEAAFEAYYRDILAADDAIEDYRAIEERKIDEAHGIY